MFAERLMIETDAQGKPTRLPQLPPNSKLEAAPPAPRRPSPAIADKGNILGDIISSVIPDSDWDALR